MRVLCYAVGTIFRRGVLLMYDYEKLADQLLEKITEDTISKDSLRTLLIAELPIILDEEHKFLALYN